MFNKEDILAELAAGKSLEAIAQEAADALNEAKAQYEAEERARAAAMVKKKELERQKAAACTDIFDEITNYMETFHNDVFDRDFMKGFRWKFDPVAMSQALDATIDELRKMPEIAKAIQNTDNKDFVRVNLSGDDAKQVEDVIAKFLRENDLL